MANFIDNIEIRNFKSIRHQKIEDCRRINLFIGYPNVGKSNLLEALSLFSIDREDFDFNSLIRMEDLTTLFFNGEINSKSEVILNRQHRYLISYEKSYLKFEYQFDKHNYGFDRIDNNFGLDKWTIRNFELGVNSRLVNSHKGGLSSETKLADVRKYEYLKKTIWDNTYFPSLKHPYGNNLFDIISKDEDLRSQIKELFRQYDLNFSFDKTTQSFKILKFVGTDIFLISFSQIADTLQRLIFYKSAISSNSEGILLFEEPEAHMFAPYISKFTSDIWYKKDNQYFLATHSPFVVNDFLENARGELAIYIIDYQNGESVIKRLSEEQVHEIYQFGVDIFMNLKSLVE